MIHVDMCVIGTRKRKIDDRWMTIRKGPLTPVPFKDMQDDIRAVLEKCMLEDILHSAGLRVQTVEEARLQSMLLDTEGRLGSLSLQCQALLNKLQVKTVNYNQASLDWQASFTAEEKKLKLGSHGVCEILERRMQKRMLAKLFPVVRKVKP